MRIVKIKNPSLPADAESLRNVLRLFFNRLVSILNQTIDKAESTSFDGSAFVIQDLPTSDPGVAGQLWNDAGTLKVSAG